MKRDYSLTIAALAAYDKFDSTFDAALRKGATQKKVLAWFAKLERLGESVGEAFGLDTSDVNSVDTCRACIRPGNPAGLSFVRKAVQE